MILVVGNTKGGVGKTTLAVNIAIARASIGKDVLLVDGDEQQTATDFTNLRTEELGDAGYTAVGLKADVLLTQVRKLAPRYDDTIIDVGGRDTGSLRAAMVAANTLLIPVQPRTFDVWAVDQIANVLKEARSLNPDLRAVAVLNAADAQGHDNEDAADAVRQVEGIELLPVAIGRRKAFSNAAASGRAVTELTPKDLKAVDELTTLLRLLYIA